MRYKQDCAQCPLRGKCWSDNAKESYIAISLLVCRIKKGIHVNKSTKALLRLLRPKVIKIASQITEECNVSLSEAIVDTESAILEYIIAHYRLDGRAYPLHYLFNRKTGAVEGWRKNYIRRRRKYEGTHFLYESDTSDVELAAAALNASATNDRIRTLPIPSQDPAMEETLDAQRNTKHTDAMRVVDDGVTLTLNEFRVMRFCLSNGDRTSKLVTGLHKYLSERSGVKRKTLSKYYRQATYRLIDATNRTEKQLQAKGVDTDIVDQARRTRWLLGTRSAKTDDQLSPEEIHALLQHATDPDVSASLYEICWAFGITNNKTYYALRDRFEGCTVEQIRAEQS